MKTISTTGDGALRRWKGLIAFCALGLSALSAGVVRAEIPFFPGELNQLSDNSGETQHVDVNGDGFLGPGDTLRGTLDIDTLEDQSGGGGTVILGSGGIEELSGIFEVEVIGFAVLTDPNGSCGNLLADPTCNGGNSLSGDETANYWFGPRANFWSLGPDGIPASGDELAPGTMVAFYQDPAPDYNRNLPTIGAIEATATDPFGPAILELGFGLSAVTGLVDGDHLWTASSTPVNPALGRLVPAGTTVGFFNVQLSILAERFPSFLFQQVAAGTTLDDGLIDVNGQGNILGTQAIATAYDLFDNTDLVVRVTGPEPLIDIEKATNGFDADLPDETQTPMADIWIGGQVNWVYVVTNTGTEDLENVAVTDDRGVALSCPQTTLAVGESMTCTASGTALDLANPANAGVVVQGICGGRTTNLYENTSSVEGFGVSSGIRVTDSDPSHYCNPIFRTRIPTLSFWGTLALVGLLPLVAAVGRRRRGKSVA